MSRILSFAGEQVEFVKTTEETGGAYLVAMVTMQPGARGPMPHVHPLQEERFEILEGKGRFRLGRDKRDAVAGETVVVEAGLGHGIANPFDDPLRVRVTWTPACDLEHFMENLFGVAMAGKTTRRGIPPLRQIALIIEAHPDSGPRVGIPSFIRRPLIKAIAGLGRLSGMSGSYPEYCPHQPRR